MTPAVAATIRLSPALVANATPHNPPKTMRVMLGIFQWFRLLLLPKHLPVGLAVGIKAIMFAPFSSGFQFGPSDVPVRTTFPQHGVEARREVLHSGLSTSETFKNGAPGWARQSAEEGVLRIISRRLGH